MTKDNPVKKDQIGWDSFEEDELRDDQLAADNRSDDAGVGCCDTAFHVVSTPEEFQELLAGLQTEGKLSEM